MRHVIHPPSVKPVDRIRLISRNNGAGLTRDLKLIKEALSEARNAPVETVGFGFARAADWWWKAKLMVKGLGSSRVGTQIFAERVYPRFLPLADRNLLIPNPEWFLPKWTPYLSSFEMVLCKTYHAQRIFQQAGCRTRYIGFTSEDRYDPGISRQRAFFHLAGHSSAKGTRVLLDTWRRHPEWPLITVVQNKVDPREVASASNIDHQVGHLNDAALQVLQNSHLFHICPSEAEGFGHCLVEGLSVGAVVITTDGEPMNELITADRGILIPAARIGTKLLASSYYVDSAGIEAAVAQALALPSADCERLGRAARAFFLDNDRAFRMRMSRLFADDSYPLCSGTQAGLPAAPNPYADTDTG